MATTLNVIALISGGKDSLFSILHCLANGHTIIALANLHPPYPSSSENQSKSTGPEDERSNDQQEGEDMDSYMYQTVGHSLIPLYASALDLPLYRQSIQGGMSREKNYEVILNSKSNSRPNSDPGDETESLIPLLQRIIKDHPHANAISTGAILSTYQRTRVESVALRLGLTPLSFLWQYPVLPPYLQSGLLRDMAAVVQDARIIKVASGGLDQSFLWENVADARNITRLGKAMARFGENGDGAVLGEGGEFETLAIDGPGVLWKRRIEVQSDGVVVGEGGSAVWRGKGARLVEKQEDGQDSGLERLRIPELWDEEFKTVLDDLEMAQGSTPSNSTDPNPYEKTDDPETSGEPTIPTNLLHTTRHTLSLSNLTSPPSASSSHPSATTQLHAILRTLSTHLSTHNLTPTSILHTTLLLRHISTFATLNPIYSTFFPSPLPPSRVTVSCGAQMPAGVDVMLSAIISKPSPTSDAAEGVMRVERKGLHVQSRSYWAPVNIGPYSQAISIPLPLPLPSSPESPDAPGVEAVYIAGQIPLHPASMAPYPPPSTSTSLTSSSSPISNFAHQALLSLQHLFRIARSQNVHWFPAAVAYVSSSSSSSHASETALRVRVAQKVWHGIHTNALQDQSSTTSSDEEEEDIDPWDLQNLARNQTAFDDITRRGPIPDAAAVKGEIVPPPCYVVQVEALPRGVDVEWVGVGLATTSSFSPFISTKRLTRGGGEGVAYATETLPLSLSSSSVSPTTVFFTYTIRTLPSLSEGRETEEFSALVAEVLDGRSMEDGFEHATLYARAGAGDWRKWCDALPGVQIVPCKAVWGEDGERVDGVLVGRMSVH